MRYAVIITNTNEWYSESDSKHEAKKAFNHLKNAGTHCVMVEVLLDSEAE